MSKKTDLKKFLIEKGLYEQGMTLEQMEACLLSNNLQDAFFIKPKKEEIEEKPKEDIEEKPKEDIEEKPKEDIEEKPKEDIEEKTKEDIEEKPKDSHDELFEAIKNAKSSNQTQEASKPLVEKKNRKIGKKESNPDSFRLQGYVLMLIINTIFPFLFSFLNNMFEKRFKIDVHELKLSDRDFKELEPLADAAADYIAVNINPVAGFMIVSAFMYGGQFVSIRSIKLAELPIESRNPKPKQLTKRPRK